MGDRLRLGQIRDRPCELWHNDLESLLLLRGLVCPGDQQKTNPDPYDHYLLIFTND